MQIKPCLTIATIWIVLVFAVGNLSFGQTYWNRTYGNSSYLRQILATPDGNFLLAGGEYPCDTGNGRIWLVKIRPNGDTLWQKSFQVFYFGTVLPTSDGNFLIGGTSQIGIGISNSDIGILKINRNGDTLF